MTSRVSISPASISSPDLVAIIVPARRLVPIFHFTPLILVSFFVARLSLICDPVILSMRGTSVISIKFSKARSFFVSEFVISLSFSNGFVINIGCIVDASDVAYSIFAAMRRVISDSISAVSSLLMGNIPDSSCITLASCSSSSTECRGMI